MVQSQSKSFTIRLRGSSRVFVISILAVSTFCLILSRVISLQHDASQRSLLGNPFEPDSQDEQKINQDGQSERLLRQSYDFGDTSNGVRSGNTHGASRDAVRDTDEVRDLRRDSYGSDQQARAGTGSSNFGNNHATYAASGNRNYNVNIVNGRSSDVSGALSYITSPVAGYGSDLVGGDITSSLNRNIRDIQKLQQQFSAPEHARRRSKLASLRRDDKMLQSTLLSTLKLQESQMNAEAAATKRLTASLQNLRGRTEQEMEQRATTSQLNTAMFELKRLAAMQRAEYKSLMQIKAQPGAPGLPGPPGPPGLNGHNGLNGRPGSIQQLVPVRRNRLVTSPDGQRSWDIHPPIPPPHRRCQDDDLNCNSQNNPNTWGSARRDPNAGARAGMRQALAQQRHMPPSPGDAEGPYGSVRQSGAVRLQHISSVPSGNWADKDLFEHKSPAADRSGLSFLPPSLPPAIPPPYVPFPNRVETLPNGVKYQTHWVSPDGQRSWDIHPPIPPPHRRCQDDDLNCNSQNNPNTWGSARRDPNAGARAGMRQALAQQKQAQEQKEAPLVLAAPSLKSRAGAGQPGISSAAAALRKLRLARLRLQSEQRNQQPLVGSLSAALLTSPSVPPLLHADEQERSRALSNAQIVMPSSVLRGKVQQANPMSYEPSEGIRRRLADVQSNQDNGGFFESPASVVEE